jgi:hypothetical protein
MAHRWKINNETNKPSFALLDIFYFCYSTFFFTYSGTCKVPLVFRRMSLTGKIVILSSFMDSSIYRQQQQQLSSDPLSEPSQLEGGGGSVVVSVERTPEKAGSSSSQQQQHCCDKCSYKSPHRHALDRHTQVDNTRIISYFDRGVYIRF